MHDTPNALQGIRMTPSHRSIRAAIVGCGVIGRHHATVLTRHPEFEVVALIDVDQHRAEAVRDGLAASVDVARLSVSDSLGDLTAAGLVDLAVIATPSGLHTANALEAIGLGLHVVIEKPLDVTTAQARPLLEASQTAHEHGRTVSVISQHRFDPASLAVRDAIDGGRFGRLTSAAASVSWWRSQDYYDGGDWRGTWALDGGGSTMNQGVHTVDLMRWFMGPVESVSAEVGLLAHTGIEVEDTAVATVRFVNGALGTILTTTAAYPGLSASIHVHGSTGSAIIDDDRLRYFHAAAPDAALRGGHGVPSGAASNHASDVVDAGSTSAAPRAADDFVLGHLRQYDDIVESIRTGRLPGVTVQTAYESLALVEGLYESARRGERVAIAELLSLP